TPRRGRTRSRTGARPAPLAGLGTFGRSRLGLVLRPLEDDLVVALAALHPQRAPRDLLVGDLVLGLAVVAEELHRGRLGVRPGGDYKRMLPRNAPTETFGWGEGLATAPRRSLEQGHQVFFDSVARFVVGGGAEGTLPHLDGFVLEPGALIEDREVLERGEVARLEID